jgi:outer membrane protein OmpA-like peptidoglycan-associated protein
MFTRYVIKRGGKDEGERPFWISFSDLMTALMALFLVVMSVTLLAVTKKVDQEEKNKIDREQAITKIMKQIRQDSSKWNEIHVNESTYRIDLGEIVRFDSGEANITPEGQAFLRGYVPTLLKAYNTEAGKRWIRRIVVEGFTDQDGTYLYNLWLSLERSRQVVCSLYAIPFIEETSLTDEQKTAIRELFLVGGYSFNSMKTSKEESRRVELKLEFWQLGEEQPAKPDLSNKEFGTCP